MLTVTAEIFDDIQNAVDTTWTTIDGLTLVIPPAEGASRLITLLFNAPFFDYTADGDVSPGASFRIVYSQGRGGSAVVVAIGGSTNQTPNDGRISMSIMRTVSQQDPESSKYFVQWQSVRGATAHIQSFDSNAPSATFTAIIGEQ
jgi:hypothetical protein